jgi:hypothetical protein
MRRETAWGPTSCWLRTSGRHQHSFYICDALIQLMENVYAELDLERNWEHPHDSPCGNRRDRNQTSGFLQTWAPGSEIPINVLDFATGRVRPLASVKPLFDSARLAVSPDGKTILVHRDTTISDLMLTENFR